METSYRWHPGVDRVTARWAVPVPLLPDELLSSWLVRAALVQGCDPLTFTGLLWPKWRVWTLDPDRGISQERLLILSKTSGLPLEALQATSLRPMAQAISASPLPERALWPWMMAQGSRNLRRTGGLQGCPACLVEDRQPYFRLSGRLAWHTACAEHQTLLISTCPHCASPIAPHRHSAMNGGAMNRCASCQGDLTQAALVQPTAAALQFQNWADQAVSGGAAYGDLHLSAAEWFEVCRYFLLLLRKAVGGRSSRLTGFLEALGVDFVTVPLTETALVLELLPVAERAGLLSAVVPLLNASPFGFRREALNARLGAETLREPRQRLPTCLEQVIQDLPERRRNRQSSGAGQGPRSRQAVLRKMARLRRKAMS